MFAFVPKPWLFASVLSTSLMLVILVVPFIVGLLEQYQEREMRHVSDTVYEYYSSFFFNQANVPKQSESKLIKFFFSLTVLVFMSAYVGVLIDEFLKYKNFDNIFVVEDIIDVKINIYSYYMYMLLKIGGINQYLRNLRVMGAVK